MTETRSIDPLLNGDGFEPEMARLVLSGENPRALAVAFTWADSPQLRCQYGSGGMQGASVSSRMRSSGRRFTRTGSLRALA